MVQAAPASFNDFPAVTAPLSKPGLSPRTGLLKLIVKPRLGAPHLGRLFAGAVSVPCVMGPAGLTHTKREGDGATPRGCFALSSGFFRADRAARPRAGRAMKATGRGDGWCDDVASACYNQPIALPAPVRHERMWRDDRLYDLGLVIDFNRTSATRAQARRGRGSAIFLHVMAEGATPTAGCIALRPQDLRRLLPRLSPRCRIQLG